MCPTGTSLTPASFADEPTSGFRRAFDVLDFDHDGKISGEDLRSFYTSFSGSGDDEEMIKAMISVADANKDGYVQYDEFEKILERREKEKKVEKSYGDGGGVMEEMFKVMDKDGDGILGVNDLKDYLKLAGLEVGDDEIKAMIKLGCGDGTNGVSFDGFVNIFGSL
ncbi:calmodulin-like [Chenopodium quinoa]|uniref:calmodulin-like n=1 Tax=Chenopodium quinoa TaxID=63459 RepID=UPI000B796076|nr:calmodulin-like [Chenopodium quinoa]